MKYFFIFLILLIVGCEIEPDNATKELEYQVMMESFNEAKMLIFNYTDTIYIVSEK